MPPKNDKQPTQDNSATEALIVSHEKHAKIASTQRETIIRQAEKNNPAPILEAQLQKLGDIHDALKLQSSPVADEHTITLRGLKGDKGDTGDKGEQGIPGVIGPKGEQGIQGIQGVVGQKGDQGERGQTGAQGVQGEKGDQGIPGARGPKGEKGNDGSPDTTETLIKKLAKKLSYNDLKDKPNLESFRPFTAGAETQIWLNGKLFSSQVRVLDFVGSGATITELGGGAVSIQVNSGGVGTIYTETPSGAIDGSNTSYTTAHTITTIFSFAINGQFIHPSDYSISGSTITFGTPLDASLSGLPFTIIYA